MDKPLQMSEFQVIWTNRTLYGNNTAKFSTPSVSPYTLPAIISLRAIEFLPSWANFLTPTELRVLKNWSGSFRLLKDGNEIQLPYSNFAATAIYVNNYSPIARFNPIKCNGIVPPPSWMADFETITAAAFNSMPCIVRFWFE